MLNLKKLAFVGLCSLFAASAMSAEAGFLADRHATRGVACATCHGVAAPEAGSTVETKQCLGCHGSLKAISEKIHQRDKAQSPDPHVNHSLGLNCNECHRGHQKSVNMCSRCHIFEYKVP